MILDTNALSATADNDTAIADSLAAAEELVIPVIVLGEYRYGIAQSRHQARYRQWLDELIPDCTILDVNEGTSHHYAAINLELRRAGTPIPTNDLWIAALGRQHSLPVLSRDRHFDLVGGIRRIHW
jgi:tRNA(fMet)-specific endonuclease VapC